MSAAGDSPWEDLPESMRRLASAHADEVGESLPRWLIRAIQREAERDDRLRDAHAAHRAEIEAMARDAAKKGDLLLKRRLEIERRQRFPTVEPKGT
jgi:hypothetical protein